MKGIYDWDDGRFIHMINNLDLPDDFNTEDIIRAFNRKYCTMYYRLYKNCYIDRKYFPRILGKMVTLGLLSFKVTSVEKLHGSVTELLYTKL